MKGVSDMENQNKRGEKEELHPEVQIERERLARIRELGIEPFGGRFERSHRAGDILSKGAALESERTEVRLAGRLVILRDHGSTAFGVLRDQTGEVQMYLAQTELSEKEWKLFKLLDTGDIIGILGTVYTTHTREVTVRVKSFEILTKALRMVAAEPGEETCRKQYVEFLAHPERKEDFQKRAILLGTIRKWLAERDFLEVETPMLQPIYSGRPDDPLITHRHALDMPLYLRMAPELYLKRLIVGGFERIFEMGRSFRNQKMDHQNYLECTSLTMYEAYGDMEDMISKVRSLLAACVEAVRGRRQLLHHGVLLDLKPAAWARMTMAEAVRKYTGADFDKAKNLEEARKLADHLKAAYDRYDTFGRILARCFTAHVRDKLIQPTIITSYPVEVSPLARKCSESPLFTARFEAYICGMEVASGLSELNDPVDQKMRFSRQPEEQGYGDDAACLLDEDFIRALEYGLPPTGTLTISIDRLAMVVLGKTDIRDVVLFPLIENG